MSTLSRNCNSDAIEKCAEAVAQLKREEGDKSTIMMSGMQERMLTGYCRIWRSCHRCTDSSLAEMQVLRCETAQRSRIVFTCSKSSVYISASSQDTWPYSVAFAGA